jgi:benzoyl-CoA reductase subunit B
MKWFENLGKLYPKAEIAMLHTPYQENGEITPEMTEYMVKQLREEVIPKMEKVSGKKLDEERLRQILENAVKVEDSITNIFNCTKNVPSPIDAYFAGVYYIGPINIGFRGTQAVNITRNCIKRYKQGKTVSVRYT